MGSCITTRVGLHLPLIWTYLLSLCELCFCTNVTCAGLNVLLLSTWSVVTLCAVFLSQRATITLWQNGFHQVLSTTGNLKKLKCKKKSEVTHTHTVSSNLSEAEFKKKPVLLTLMMTTETFNRRRMKIFFFSSFFADPGSGLVGGGGQEQGGGSSFQVWQRDRHVSVD